MKKSPTLSLSLRSNSSKQSDNTSRQALSPTSPRSPPVSDLQFTQDSQGDGSIQSYEVEALPTQPHLHPQSPTSPKHKKEPSRSIFSKNKAPKSSSRIQLVNGNPQRKLSDSQAEKPNLPVYPYRQSPGSTPELALTREDEGNGLGIHDQANDGASIKSSNVPSSHDDIPVSKKSGTKHRFPKLTRSRSIRSEDTSRDKPKLSTPTRSKTREQPYDKQEKHGKQPDATLRTAPLEKDRSFREMMSSTIRNHSTDRHERHNAAPDIEEDNPPPPPPPNPKERRDPFISISTSLSNIRHTSTKAADGIGKASKGFLGKLTRNGHSEPREPPVDVENYVPKVIVLPLVEQTRITRISKRLEASKDKTEFWMPALPWRCIDYLNMKGCEEEGLYRVPGSGRDIKHWQMRFDKELDINLFDQEDLYDINTIGSMFKAWLRELPDEIFPKSTQARIAEQCKGAKSTPQMLKDELSKLPPFNYYLLFAITCHISLLHSCSEMNKMDYRNLCICFQPCMKIEAFCFQWLVLDWRNCWQGCWTEKEYLTEELRVMNSLQAPPSAGRSFTSSISQGDQRAISSSGSSKPSSFDSATPEKQRPPPLKPTRSNEMEEEGATPTQPGPPRLAPELPAISPMKPLSPIGSL